MARVALHGLWQQKHPTPSGAGWEFHWHGSPPLPPAIAAAVTGELAALDLALAGEGSGVVFAPGWVAWVRAFSAAVPSEQRSYVGLAGAVAVGGDGFAEALPSVLEALELPPAAPYAAELPARFVDARPASPAAVNAVDAEAVLGLARLCVAGGRAAVDAPGDAEWPRRLGRLLAWLPPEARVRPRNGLLVVEARPAVAASPVEENVCHYLARGWSHPDGLATWKLLLATRRPLFELFEWLGELAAAWETAADLERWLRGVLTADEIARCDSRAPAPLFADDGDAGTLWNRVVHYWGRGLLDGPGVDERLGRVLAGRVLVDHLVRLDSGDAELPMRYLRRLRYEALLPAPRAQLLVNAFRRALPGLP